MNTLFEVKDKTGRRVYLLENSWKHIIREHPELSNSYERIKETLMLPLLINVSHKDKDVHYYHRRYKEKDAYLIVLVKYLNGVGFIISSYYAKKTQQ